MTAHLLSLVLLGSSPELGQITDHLFHHSDVRAAAKAADQFVAEHPDDSEGLELAMIAHAALGDASTVNQLAARRAARGDKRALAALLFAWEHAHTPRASAEVLLPAAQKLLPELSPAQGAPLRLVIGHLERTLGRFDEAAAAAHLPGQITDWQIIGPFDNEQNVGFSAVSPPERSVNLGGVYPGKVGDVRWQPFLTTRFDGTLCLACAQSPNEWTVSYLASWVQASSDTDVALWAKADDHLKLWINGRLAASEDSAKGIADGQVRAGARLHKGWNLVLLKVAQREGAWEAGLRITRPDGSPLSGLVVSSSAHPTTPAAASERWPNGPADPVVETFSKETGALVDHYLRAWRLYELGQVRESWILFENLARLGPDCAICLEGVAMSAHSDEDRDRALTALGEAMEIDRGFASAAVERARIHYRMGLYEAAESEARAGVDANPRDGDALAVLAELRQRRKFWVEAARLSAQAAEAQPGWAWYAVLRARSAEAQGDPALAESVLREAIVQTPSEWEAVRELAALEMVQGRRDEAANLLEGWLAHNPEAQATRNWLAEVRLASHQDALAKQQIAEIRRRNPGTPAADELEGELANRDGDRAGAAAAYRRALVRSPSDWDLRDRLQILDPTADVTEPYQVSETEVLDRARRTQAADHPDDNAVVLLGEESLIAHEDGSKHARVHFAVKVFDEAGIERYLNYSVRGAPNVKLLLARTIDSQGSFHEVSSIDHGEVHFPNPTPGSTFEIIYTVDERAMTGKDWWGLFGFQDLQPALDQRWIVASPAGIALRTWKRGTRIKERHESLAAAEIHVFEARDEPPVADEPHGPPYSTVSDIAMVSSFPDWDAVTRWMRASVDDQLALDMKEPEVKALAKRLTEHAHTADQKVAALSNFVRNEIHYNQADTDIYRWRAHPARRVLETRYGDCKDKATLFEALAASVGLRVDHAVLLVNVEGQTPIEIPSQWFDHAVAYLPAQPGLSRPGLLDLTATGLDPGSVPFMDQDANALVFHPGVPGSRIEHIPFASSDDAKRRTTFKLSVDASGGGRGSLEEKIQGEPAAEFRWRYRNITARPTSLDALAGVVVPGAIRVGRAKVTGLDHPEQPMNVHLEVQAPNLLRQVGDTTLLHMADRYGVEEWIHQSERREPMRLGYPVDNQIHREITLPKQMTVTQLPPPVHLDGEYFTYDLTAKRMNDHQVSIDTHFVRKVAEVPPEKFLAFRKAAQDLDHATDFDLELRPSSNAQIGQR